MSRILQFFDPVIRFALPPRCAHCGVVVAGDDQLCVTCWSQIDFLGGTGCTHCGVPVDHEGLTCGPCLQSLPRHDGARAVVAYDDMTRALVMRLKYGRRTGLARGMAAAMARLSTGEAGLLVPVPLHRWRLWSRGFNQSLLLARGIAAQTGQTVLPDALIRIKATPPLRELGAKARAKVVKSAFAMTDAGAAAVRGQDVILVDDVYTSGATVNACAAVLKRAGAQDVRVLAWARVPLPGASRH